MCSSTVCLTSVLERVGGQRHAPIALPQENDPVPILYEAGSGRVRIISPPSIFDPRTVQPVASRCTDWSILAQMFVLYINLLRNKFAVFHCAPLVTATDKLAGWQCCCYWRWGIVRFLRTGAGLILIRMGASGRPLWGLVLYCAQNFVARLETVSFSKSTLLNVISHLVSQSGNFAGQ
jgi:hypothetical protein